MLPRLNNIMHGLLETSRGFHLMGADNPPGVEHAPGNNIAISLSGDDVETVARLLGETLRRGHGGLSPLEKQMWGDEFGMCVDRFGIRGW
jgi:PhnB protein